MFNYILRRCRGAFCIDGEMAPRSHDEEGSYSAVTIWVYMTGARSRVRQNEKRRDWQFSNVLQSFPTIPTREKSNNMLFTLKTILVQ